MRIMLRQEAHARLTRYLSLRLSRTRRGEKLAGRLVRWSPTSGVYSADYHGIRLALDLRDNVQRRVFYRGGYEEALLGFLLDELEPMDTFVDVGAHIGVFALPAARKLARGRVIAFEPADDTAEILERAVQRSGVRSLTLVRAGLGDTTAVGTLRGSPDWDVKDLAVRSLHGKGLAVADVPIIRFDDWACETQLGRLDVVKIDVEGHELSVLNGMCASLTRHRPRLLILEIVESHLRRAGTTPREVTELVDGFGYEAVGATIEQIAAGRTDVFWPNARLRLRT